MKGEIWRLCLFYSEKGIKRRRSGYNSKEILCFFSRIRTGKAVGKDGNRLSGGDFAVFLLAWTLCRAAGWEKEREDLEQEQYLKEWREKKLKKSKKI